MGVVRRSPGGPLCHLEADHLVGRSSRAALRLSEGYVSSQHAVLRWSGSEWELRDLSSRNGTFVNGKLIDSRDAVALTLGALICFGDREQEWELVDASSPTAMAIPADPEQPPILAVDDILAVPSTEGPLATIFRAGGSWVLERPDSTSALFHHQSFEVNGVQYRFSRPDAVSRTATADWRTEASLDVRELQLRFTVSRDQEHIELSAATGSTTHALGTRGHNYLLLLLARQRIEDQTRGLPQSECGWVYQEQVLAWLREPQERLNVDVFRIRKQFAALQLSNAADIIERRHSTRQMRIGAPLLEITAA